MCQIKTILPEICHYSCEQTTTSLRDRAIGVLIRCVMSHWFLRYLLLMNDVSRNAAPVTPDNPKIYTKAKTIEQKTITIETIEQKTITIETIEQKTIKTLS